MNMKFALFAIIMVLAMSTGLCGTSVDGLHLKSVNDETTLKIDVGGPFQFSHQIEEAKDGKPYRIIVDIFPAVHNLNQKIFAALPASIITAIRTSQYSVKPDKIVRVVLDLKNPAIYRIEKSGNFAFIYIPDSEHSDFAEWSSAGAKGSLETPSEESPVAEASPVAIPAVSETPIVSASQEPVQNEPAGAEEEFEIQNSISEEKSVAISETRPQPVPSSLEDERNVVEEKPVLSEAIGQPAEALAPPARYYKPNQSSFFEQEMAANQAQRENAVETQTPPVSPVVSVQEKPLTTQTPEPLAKTQDSSMVEMSIATASQPQSSPAPQPKPAMPPRPPEEKQVLDNSSATVSPAIAMQSTVENRPADSTSKSENVNLDSSVVDTYLSPDDMPAITLSADSAVDSSGQRPTSHFRREPNFPNKLKGTIVAEFPQRMVIEYAPGVFRDPFETLIDETKQSDGPREDKIPDVETSRLVGVIETEAGDNRALLEDLDGYGYILKSGDKVKKGYVEKIDIDKAFFQLFEYGWSRTIALYLGHN